MADVPFTAGIAIKAQSALGTPETITSQGILNEADGIVLGDRDSGTGETGITLPDFVRVESENSDLGFTAQASNLERIDPQNLAVAWKLKGNGATATPAVGEAQPAAGIDAILQGAGLVGANGAAGAEYVYTPRTGQSTIYLTIRLWVDRLTWLFQDVLVDTLTLTPTPGGALLAQAAFGVGSLNSFVQAPSAPSFDYGNQASLSAPLVVNAGFDWVVSRGFRSWEVALANSLENFPDSNQPSGQRVVQSQRRVTVTGSVYAETSDRDAAYSVLSASSAPTADASYRIGTAAGASDEINGVQIATNNLQITQYKPEAAGKTKVSDVEGRATATTEGGEFSLTFD